MDRDWDVSPRIMERKILRARETGDRPKFNAFARYRRLRRVHDFLPWARAQGFMLSPAGAG